MVHSRKAVRFKDSRVGVSEDPVLRTRTLGVIIGLSYVVSTSTEYADPGRANCKEFNSQDS